LAEKARELLAKSIQKASRLPPAAPLETNNGYLRKRDMGAIRLELT
jgi:hypothetical protein